MEPEFDALLKAHVKRHANVAVCTQFDPDDATAYLERALSTSALAMFEEHLASCAVCRRQIIELSNLMPSPPIVAEPMVAASSLKGRLSAWFSGWRLGALAGLSAVAATVLVVAIVVNRSDQETSLSQVAANRSEPQASPRAEAQDQISPITSAAELKKESKPLPSASPAANLPPTGNAGTAKAVAIETAPVAVPAQPAAATSSGVAAAPPPPPTPAPTLAIKKAEAESKDFAANQAKAVSNTQIQNLRGQTPSGPEVNQMQAERALESRKRSAQQVQSAADSAAPAPAKSASKASEPPPERVIERNREKVEEAETKQAKPKAMKQPPLAMAQPSRSRVVGGKVFRQENGSWTDEAYDSSKGLPLIRLKRDSEEYKQLLKDTPGLKPYFDLKPVIVVWQGKVYRVENK